MNENLNNVFPEAEGETLLTPDNTQVSDGGIDVEIVNSAGNGKKSYHLFPENSLKEILDICGKDPDLGLISTNQCKFEYNGVIYSDPNLTIGKLNVLNGSKLLICPNGQNAAEAL